MAQGGCHEILFSFRMRRITMRFNLARWLLLVLLSVGAVSGFYSPLGAQDSSRKEGNHIVQNFRFQNGETLAELRLHYVTLGTPKRDAGGHVTNAVLLLHGTNGNGNAILANLSHQLFEEGQPLD